MAKPPVKKPVEKSVEPAEFTTDAPRQGPIGEVTPPTEADLIAADAGSGKPQDKEDA